MIRKVGNLWQITSVVTQGCRRWYVTEGYCDTFPAATMTASVWLRENYDNWNNRNPFKVRR